MIEQTPFAKLQDWYVSNCNGDWEHTYGVTLKTSDNPGWILSVDLEETALEHQPFTKRILNQEHSSQWIIVSKEGMKLKASCGPSELETMISIVVEWLAPRR